jgi:hypothetical protein
VPHSIPCAAQSSSTQVPHTESADSQWSAVAARVGEQRLVPGVHRLAAHAKARALQRQLLPHAWSGGQSTVVPGTEHGAPSTWTVQAAWTSAAASGARIARTGAARALT